jgi:hypothetical protein
VGASRQLGVARHLFAAKTELDPESPSELESFVASASAEIAQTPRASDFMYDRLDRSARRSAGLGEMSRRQYNKRFRFLARMEAKQARLEREIRRRRFTQVSKSPLASRLSWEEFSHDDATAAFIAYYAARCNMRSVFTNKAQERPYDVLARALLNRAKKGSKTNWWAIAHVHAEAQVLEHLSDSQKGTLLAKWTVELRQLAIAMREVWEKSSFSLATMIVKRGDDSSTWNALAGAWNRARAQWIALLFALGQEKAPRPHVPRQGPAPDGSRRGRLAPSFGWRSGARHDRVLRSPAALGRARGQGDLYSGGRLAGLPRPRRRPSRKRLDRTATERSTNRDAPDA